jgi:hypothetical protein
MPSAKKPRERGEPMHFRITYLVRDLHLTDDTEATFEYRGSSCISVNLRPHPVGANPEPHELHSADCLARTERAPSAQVYGHFNELAARFEGGEKDEVVYRVSPDGTREQRTPALWDTLPQPLRDFADQVYGELQDAAVRLVRLLRWRLHARGPHRPFVHLEREFSFDGTVYYHMPQAVQSFMEISSSLNIEEPTHDEIQRLLADETDEPLAHDLYREAWEQRFINPRSALVLGIAALETAVKRTITVLAPDAAWLVTSLQSPPVERMLREYLPQLSMKGEDKRSLPSPPDSILKMVQRGVGWRNDLVHGKKIEIALTNLHELLEAIGDVLWVCDYAAGYEWALIQVRPTVRRAWGLTLSRTSA